MRAGFSAYEVRSITHLNDCSIWITLDAVLDAQPGQFVMAWLPGIGEKPFSVAALDPLSLLVVDVGSFSHALHFLHPGERVWIKGPLGNGFFVQGKSAVLVGGGYGAAPLLALAKQMVAGGLLPKVCLGARSESGLLLQDQFKALGCTVAVTTEDGSAGLKGLVTQAVKQTIDHLPTTTLYACGPNGMLSACAALAKEAGIPYQLSWEALMRCGMGLCGSCEVPRSYDEALPEGWLACFDGPVFCWRPDD